MKSGVTYCFHKISQNTLIFRLPVISQGKPLTVIGCDAKCRDMDVKTFSLRPGQPQDAALIREFVRAAYAKWVPVMGREPLPMTADYDAALQNHRFVLAFEGNDLAGMIETVAKADHLWVENIAIRPDLQGHGLGRRLLAVAEDQARDAGLARMRLLTNAALTANVAFYKRYGFGVEATQPFCGGFVVYFGKSV